MLYRLIRARDPAMAGADGEDQGVARLGVELSAVRLRMLRELNLYHHD